MNSMLEARQRGVGGNEEFSECTVVLGSVSAIHKERGWIRLHSWNRIGQSKGRKKKSGELKVISESERLKTVYRQMLSRAFISTVH